MLSLLSDNWRLVLSMVLALLIGWNIRVPVFKMAILKNFVDKPNKRSSHTGCVPNIGGIVVFLAFLCSCTGNDPAGGSEDIGESEGTTHY